MTKLSLLKLLPQPKKPTQEDLNVARSRLIEVEQTLRRLTALRGRRREELRLVRLQLDEDKEGIPFAEKRRDSLEKSLSETRVALEQIGDTLELVKSTLKRTALAYTEVPSNLWESAVMRYDDPRAEISITFVSHDTDSGAPKHHHLVLGPDNSVQIK